MDDWSLDRWVDEIWKLYGHHDGKRSVSNMWTSLGIYVSNIAEGLRKARYDELFVGLAHTFVWLAAFVAKCQRDETLPALYRIDERLSDLVALKYPGRCSHCNSAPCICSVQRSLLEGLKNKTIAEEELKQRRQLFLETTAYRNWTVDQWFSMFQGIFKDSYMPLPIETIGFHLAEEVGEVAHAIRELTHLEGAEDEEIARIDEARLELRVEIGDCLSWISALFLRSKAVVESAGAEGSLFEIKGTPTFSQLLKSRFAPKGKLGCPTCDYANPCVCTIWLVRYIPAPETR